MTIKERLDLETERLKQNIKDSINQFEEKTGFKIKEIHARKQNPKHPPFIVIDLFHDR